MSRTDKDRPFWVIRHVENFSIDHNHQRGECVVETLEYARAWNAGAYRNNHRHTCLKRIEHEYYCTEAEPYRRYTYSWKYMGVRENRGQSECWGSWKEPWYYVGWRGRDLPGVEGSYIMRTKKNGCLGPHRRWEYVDAIPCVCNGWPPVPTCDPSWSGPALGWRYSHYGLKHISMSERCRVEWHGPERRRSREAGGAWVKEWNAGGDMDDWDYENRQARRTAIWHAY